MFYFFKQGKKSENWRRALSYQLNLLVNFLSSREDYSVTFTSRLSDKKGRPDKSLLNRNTVFIEKNKGEIISALMLSPEGIVCPVLTDTSRLEPMREIINASTYIKKRYLTLMGLKPDIELLEKLFSNRNRISVDYDLLAAESSVIQGATETYLNRKDTDFPGRCRIRRAAAADIDILMPLRKAYEIEEVILNPDSFNEPACRRRFLDTISSQAVFFAEIDGRPAATCCISATGFNWCSIGGVFTLPQYRAKGFSAMLMAETAEYAFSKNKDLMLFVKKDNKAALKLYSNCGFKNRGEYRISYLESR